MRCGGGVDWRLGLQVRSERLSCSACSLTQRERQDLSGQARSGRLAGVMGVVSGGWCWCGMDMQPGRRQDWRAQGGSADRQASKHADRQHTARWSRRFEVAI